MAVFSYVARTRAGERVSGTVDAPDRRMALIQIERLGHVPISVKEGGGGGGRDAAKKPKGRSGAARPRRSKALARMNLRETLFFTRELSDLLSSGMTLGNALNTLARRDTGKAQDVIVPALRDEIVQGTSLSDALAKWPDTFSTLYVSMVRAGEASGQLAEVLSRLCRHFERVQDAREKVLAALTYPSIIFGVGVITIIFAMVFVMPRFTMIFAELGATLPLPTQIMIAMSHGLVRYWWVLVLLIGGSVSGVIQYVRTPDGTRAWHRLQLRLPLVRGIIRANAFSQFARTLGALLANGVPVLDALSIVEHTVGNRLIAEEIRNARHHVTDGTTISAPLAAGRIFPRLLTDMLAVGEETGDMSGALTHIANRYDYELDRDVKFFTTILEPLLILLIATVVGFMAISMLVAIFDLTSGLQV